MIAIIKQTVLPFKLEMTKDMITSHAGLALLGEFVVGLGLLGAIDKNLPAPGSGAGYRASKHIFPLILMLNGGGRSLEDLQQLRDDKGLREVLGLERRMPSSDATGDWLRRSGINGSLEGLAKVIRRAIKRGLKHDGIKDYYFHRYDWKAGGLLPDRKNPKYNVLQFMGEVGPDGGVNAIYLMILPNSF